MTEHRDENGRLAMARSAIAKRLRKHVITEKTQKYRVITRGRMYHDEERLRKRSRYHSPEAMERRRKLLKEK